MSLGEPNKTSRSSISLSYVYDREGVLFTRIMSQLFIVKSTIIKQIRLVKSISLIFQKLVMN